MACKILLSSPLIITLESGWIIQMMSERHLKRNLLNSESASESDAKVHPSENAFFAIICFHKSPVLV